MATGAGVVVAAAVKWSPVQELPLQCSGRRCQKVAAGAVSKSIRLSELSLKRAVRLRGW